MSYNGGQYMVNTLRSHYANERVEAGIYLTCQSCGHSRKVKIPHSTKNADVVAKFRGLGWKCTKNGFRARCPVCTAKEEGK